MDIEELLKDYELDWGSMSEVDDKLLKVNELPLPEKIILVLYAELQSYRKVAKILNCSHQSVGKVINKIREKLC